MAGVWLTNTYGKFATVAERLKPESLYQRFVDYRESLGFEVLPLTGGERPPFEILAERLRDNGLVCLMSDRDLTRSGVQVDFFGEPPDCPQARPSWRSRPAPRCCPSTAGTNRTIAVTTSPRRWTRRRATSASSPRRWPTASPPASPPTPPTGTCCSRSGSPICPRSAGRGSAAQERGDPGNGRGEG